MNTRKTFKQILWAGLLAGGIVFGGTIVRAQAAATPAPSLTDTQDVLRAYLRVQEELHAVRLAVENNHKDAEDIAARNVQALGDKLNSIEQSIGSQRATELQALQASNRLMLIVTGVLALLGLGIVAFAYLQWRTMHRFTEAALGFQVQQQLGGGTRLSAMVDASEPRLLSVIDRLEQRIRELEQSNHLPLPAVGDAPVAGQGARTLEHTARAADAANVIPATPGGNDQVSLLLNKGQSLLSVGQHEAAIACYDELLALQPTHVEALVKKGAVLEKLGQLNEAIACYDRAIAADQTVTIAYLYKGGVYNRMERYNEALECYEKALKTQEKPKAA